MRFDSQNATIQRVCIDAAPANTFDARLIAKLRKVADEAVGHVQFYSDGRFFSSGLNLRQSHAFSRPEMQEFIVDFQNLLRALLGSRAFFSAEIKGHCIAGGFVFAAALDCRILHPGRFAIGMNEKVLGIQLPPVPIALLKICFGNSLPTILNADHFYSPENFPQEAGFFSAADNPACQPPAGWQSRKAQKLAGLDDAIGKQFEQQTERFLDSWFSPAATAKREAFLQKK